MRERRMAASKQAVEKSYIISYQNSRSVRALNKIQLDSTRRDIGKGTGWDQLTGIRLKALPKKIQKLVIFQASGDVSWLRVVQIKSTMRVHKVVVLAGGSSCHRPM